MSNEPYDMPIDPAWKLVIVVLIGLVCLLGFGWYQEYQNNPLRKLPPEQVHRLTIEVR